MTLMGGVIIRLSNLPVRGAVTFLNRITHLGREVRHRMIFCDITASQIKSPLKQYMFSKSH